MSSRLSNIKIQNYFESYKPVKYRKNFIACIANNGIKKQNPHQYGFYIINLSKSNKSPESHWVLLYITSKCNLYFDSFGLPCSQEILNFLKRNDNPVIYNDKDIQSIKFSRCVFFATFLVEKLMKSKQIEKTFIKFVQQPNSILTSERIIDSYQRKLFTALTERIAIPT